MEVCPACREALPAGSEWRCNECGYAADRRDGIVLLSPEIASGPGGFDPAAFAALAALEESSAWFVERTRLISWAVGHYFPAARSLLEVGSGTGVVLKGLRREFPALDLVGSELFAEGLAHARARVPDVSLLQLDARRLPFRAEFDVVGAFDVLEHIEEDELVMREIAAAVQPGGGIIVTVPQHPALWGPADEFARHVRRYTRRELRTKLVAAGFVVRRLTSFVSLPFPAMIAARVVQRAAPASTYDPSRELRLPRSLNALLGHVLSAERALIRMGLTFPAGGSLLAVATIPGVR